MASKAAVPPQDLARALGIQDDSDEAKILLNLPIEEVEVFWLEFSSIYLPKFLLFFQEGPYDALNEAHFSFLGSLATSLLKPHLEKLFREQPEAGGMFWWWALFVLGSFPVETFESPQLLTHLNLILILLDSLTNLLLTQLDPTLFLPSDELASSIYDPLSLSLPLFKTTLARALESSSSSPDQQTGFLEMQARLKELTWLIEEDKEGALWRRQKASVKAGWLHWWRCPRDTWMERDGGGKDGEDGCRQIETHLKTSAEKHDRLCFRPEW
ncbi:hypothetical protein BDY24DRAFT_419149 [Mrakia frigida]|uniref:uncharacterized protein n=1 Tax=Mrakia frigida TaxID=29902 RepID=UPI003FCBFB3C